MRCFNFDEDDTIQHFGVLGMHWGHKKDSYYNKDYDKKQRLRDSALYGNGGVNRINKNINKGYGVSGSRSIEARRIEGASKRARVSRKVGGVVGGIAGAIGGYAVAKKLMQNQILPSGMYTYQIAGAGATAGAYVGSILGKSGGQSVAMISAGYAPNKSRY